jgi:membrane protease subunit HflC
MRKAFGPPALVAAVLLLSAYSAFFTVQQTQVAIVVQLGEIVSDPLGPGLHIKIPFIQRVVRIENSLLDYAPPELELLSADSQNLLVSCYAKWRVADPTGFHQRVGDKAAALRHLGDVIEAELRAAFGKQRLSDILSSGRSAALEDATARSRAAVKAYGIDLADLRIRNIRLTPANLEAAWERMRTEFAAAAEGSRAAGQATRMTLMAEADRRQAAILAEARLSALGLRGQAEAEATRIYAAAYGQDPEYFEFTRTLEASRNALNEKSILILSPEYELLRFLKRSGGDKNLTP